jgi:uncharacterized protein
MEMAMYKKLLLITLTTTLLNMPVYAAEDAPLPKLTISAEGESQVAPDMALLSLSVVRQGKTAREALDENSKAMSNVLAAMKEFNIDEKDLQTSNFSIQPNYIYPNMDRGENFPPKIVSYNVSNALTVRVRDLKKVGEILDKSVTLGVNEGGSVAFIKDDASQALEEARRKAVENALAKAKTLTDAAGVNVGRILEISEQVENSSPRPIMQAEMMMAKSRAMSDTVPIASGESSYRVTVNMVFAINQ